MFGLMLLLGVIALGVCLLAIAWYGFIILVNLATLAFVFARFVLTR